MLPWRGSWSSRRCWTPPPTWSRAIRCKLLRPSRCERGLRMASPRITVGLAYADLNEVPLRGKVTFVPSSQIKDAANHLIYPSVGVSVTLDSLGLGAVQLVYTDLDTVSPSPFRYHVIEDILGV